jgi:hypothetical protein
MFSAPPGGGRIIDNPAVAHLAVQHILAQMGAFGMPTAAAMNGNGGEKQQQLQQQPTAEMLMAMAAAINNHNNNGWFLQ